MNNKYNKTDLINIIFGILTLIITIKSLLTNHILEGMFEVILSYIYLKITKWNKILVKWIIR